jgi:hypothetical protein
MSTLTKQTFDPVPSDPAQLATVCFVVGFCVGLGLAVAALTDRRGGREPGP